MSGVHSRGSDKSSQAAQSCAHRDVALSSVCVRRPARILQCVCLCVTAYVFTVAEHTQLQLYTDRAFNPRHDSSLQVPHIHFLVT